MPSVSISKSWTQIISSLRSTPFMSLSAGNTGRYLPLNRYGKKISMWPTSWMCWNLITKVGNMTTCWIRTSNWIYWTNGLSSLNWTISRIIRFSFQSSPLSSWRLSSIRCDGWKVSARWSWLKRHGKPLPRKAWQNTSNTCSKPSVNSSGRRLWSLRKWMTS